MSQARTGTVPVRPPLKGGEHGKHGSDPPGGEKLSLEIKCARISTKGARNAGPFWAYSNILRKAEATLTGLLVGQFKCVYH